MCVQKPVKLQGQTARNWVSATGNPQTLPFVTATTILLQQLQHHPTTITQPIIATAAKVLKAPATPTTAAKAMAEMKTIPTAPAAIPARAAAAIPAAATLAVTVAEHPPAAIPAESPPNKIQFVQPQKKKHSN